MLCALLLTASLVAHVSVFPGSGESVSHQGRYRISWVAPATPTAAHTLVLTDTRSGTSSTLRHFSRHVDVLWAPTDLFVAVTDHSGSSESSVLVFSPTTPSAPVTLPLPARIAAAVAPHHHVYLRAIRWETATRLLVGVEAHDNPAALPFSTQFRYQASQPHPVRSRPGA